MRAFFLTLLCLFSYILSIGQIKDETVNLKDGTSFQGRHIRTYSNGVLYKVDRVLSESKDIKSDLLLIPSNLFFDKTFRSTNEYFEPGWKVSSGANTILTGIGIGLATFLVSQLNDRISSEVYLVSSGISTGLIVFGFLKISSNAKYLDAIRY